MVAHLPLMTHAVATEVFQLAAVVRQPEIVERMVREQRAVVAVGAARLGAEQVQAGDRLVAHGRLVARQELVERRTAVAAHRALEEKDLLVDVSDGGGEFLMRQFLGRAAIEGDAARPGAINAGDQLGEGGFAAARAPYKRHPLAGGDAERDIGQQWRFALAIAEGHVLNLNPPAQPASMGRRAAQRLIR
jgi:hypothetical protein